MAVFVLCLVTLCSPGHAVSETGNPDLDRAYKLHCDGELQEAIDVYSKVAATDTDTSHIRQAMFATAACYFDLRDYDTAVAAFLDFARMHPDDKQAPLALVYAGNCRMDQKQFAEAQPLYEEALTTESNGRDATVWLPWANLGMGRLLTKLGRYNDAIPFLDKAIEQGREPKVKVEASLFKSECLSGIGAKEDATKPFQDILSMDTSGPYPARERAKWQYWATYDKATILQEQGRQADAIAAFGDIARDTKNPFSFDAGVNAARIALLGLSQPEQARSMLNDVLITNTDPKREAELRYHLAYCGYAEGKWAAARDGFRAAAAMCTNSDQQASMLYMAGNCSVRLGDTASARAEFGEAASHEGASMAPHARVRLEALPKGGE